MKKLKDYVIMSKLNKTEEAIFNLVGMGLSNKEISNQLFKSEHSVKLWINRVYKKCGFYSRANMIVNYLALSDFGVDDKYKHLLEVK